MIHHVVSEIWVFRMGSTILEHPVYSDLAYHVFETKKRDNRRYPEFFSKLFAECEVKTPPKKCLHFGNLQISAGLLHHFLLLLSAFSLCRYLQKQKQATQKNF